MEQSFLHLAEKYLTDDLVPDEVVLFCERLKQEDNRLLLANMIDDHLQSGDFGKSKEHGLRDLNFIKIRERLRAGDIIATVHKVPIMRRTWFRYAAAAVLILLSGGVYLWFYLSSNTHSTQRVVSDVITPGGNKATLTLADGSTIILDNLKKGYVANQGNTKLYKSDSGLAYSKGTTDAKKTLLNTISTPRGGKYHVVLPDGSKLWLNSASSVTFPAAFGQGERRVKLTGEAYFEIKADTERPFYVSVNEMEVQVLGTTLNINAYTDAKWITTSLVQGSVQVSAFSQVQVLKPGEEAVVLRMDSADKNSTGHDTDRIHVRPTNVNTTVAWKNGLFSFDNMGLEEVMQQLARWYDVKVIYQDGISDIRFGGVMSKALSLSSVLQALENVGIYCRIEPGRRLVVLRGKD